MVHKKIYKSLDDLSRDLNINRKHVDKLNEGGEIMNAIYQHHSNAKSQTCYIYTPGVNSTADILLFSIFLASIPALLTKFVISQSNFIISWISHITNARDIPFLEGTFKLFIGLSLSFVVPIIIGLLWKQEYATHIKYRWGFVGTLVYVISWGIIIFFTLLNLSIDLYNIGK